jgi:DNA-binding MarR family transcriptional regulator
LAANGNISEEILIALRRVIRAIDLHSRELVISHGMTGPQALLLTEIVRAGSLTGSELAARVSLSQATVTDVVKRLEARGWLQRSRSEADRRRVMLTPTDEGAALVRESLPLLQDRFQQRLSGLREWEQLQLLSSLQRIAEMMNAEDLDAAPMLASGAITATAQAIEEALTPPQSEAPKKSGG